ncbi:hypothetical protein ADL26_19475, partial [Thermoactinomyces vulgaris]
GGGLTRPAALAEAPPGVEAGFGERFEVAVGVTEFGGQLVPAVLHHVLLAAVAGEPLLGLVAELLLGALFVGDPPEVDGLDREHQGQRAGRLPAEGADAGRPRPLGGQ